MGVIKNTWETSGDLEESLLQSDAHVKPEKGDAYDEDDEEEEVPRWLIDPDFDDPEDSQHPSFSCSMLWRYMGPGWLMSLAYLDPGNLEADLQAGAFAGYQLLWVLLLATAMGLLLQILAARLGVVTGKTLARVCRDHYPAHVKYPLWMMTELAIIGSDIQEVVGSAIAFKLLFGLPLWAGCLITAGDAIWFFALEICGQRYVELFFCSLITAMAACFFVDVTVAQPETSKVFEGTFVPQVSSYAVLQAVGIIGAVIMPHNIYLHSGLVNADEDRRVNRQSKSEVSEANKYNAIESTLALIASFIINTFVVISFAAAFYSKTCAEGPEIAAADQGTMACIPGAAYLGDGETMYGNLNSGQYCQTSYTSHGHDQDRSWICSSVGLENAGEALKDTFPNATAEIMWGIGLLAAGAMSTVTGTRAGQYVMEGFISIKVKRWQRVVITRSIALGPAIAFALMQADSPSIGDTLNQWLNILQSVQLPFALIPVLHFTSRRDIMGPFQNSMGLQALCWSLALLVIGVNFYLVYSTLDGLDLAWWVLLIIAIVCFCYLALLLMVISEDALAFWHWAQVQLGMAQPTPVKDSTNAIMFDSSRDSDVDAGRLLQ